MSTNRKRNKGVRRRRGGKEERKKEGEIEE
jgi:hypothetical protein